MAELAVPQSSRTQHLVQHLADPLTRPPAVAHVAVRVLTQRGLLERIGGFMSGVPFVVGQFAAQEEAARRARERDSGQKNGKPIEMALYPQPRGYLPQLAIIRDDLAMLARLYRVSGQMEHRYNPRLEFHEVVRCAVMFDRLDILQWLGQHCELAHYDFEGNLLNYAIHYSGDLRVLDWLAANVPPRFVRIRPWQLCIAASRGNLGAIRWLHEHDYDTFSPLVMDTAAANGHLEVVKFLHEHRQEGCSVEAMDMAAANGHLEVVKFLHEHRDEGCTTVAMGCAAGCGHAEVVAFLGKHRPEGPHPRALEDAAKNGHLECVRLLCRYSSRGCIFQARKCAAKAKHYDIVQYLSSLVADNVWSCNSRRHASDGPRRCQRNQYAMVLQRKLPRDVRRASVTPTPKGGLLDRLMCSRDASVIQRRQDQ